MEINLSRFCPPCIDNYFLIRCLISVNFLLIRKCRTLETQDGLVYEFDAGIWSSLVQEVIVKAKDDIVFKFKNGFEVRV